MEMERVSTLRIEGAKTPPSKENRQIVKWTFIKSLKSVLCYELFWLSF